MVKYLPVVALLVVTLCMGPVFGQIEYEEFDTPVIHKNERAFTFSLATNGLAIGGLYRKALPGYFQAGLSLEFLILRDDKEFETFDPFFGTPIKINDVNQLYMIPLNLELKKRLFAQDIENNFRPHAMLQVGAIYGMNFPREFTLNGVQQKRDNQFSFTTNIVIGFGADISTKENFFFTIRPQYRITAFTSPIAGSANHNAFEIKFEVGGLR